MADVGFIAGIILAITAAVAAVTLVTLAYVRIGSRRWKVVGEGVVEGVVTLEVAAGVTPLENGFVSPAVSMTMVNFTDGTRTEVPYDQRDKCVVGKRIRVSRNWIGERSIVHLD